MNEIMKNKSKCGKIWEVKKKILEGKMQNLSASVIKDPATGIFLTSNQDIKEVSVNYCKNILKDNPPEERFRDIFRKKRKMIKKWENENDGIFEAKFETFISLIRKFKKSRKPNYHFLVKAGNKFQRAVFIFCEKMLKN